MSVATVKRGSNNSREIPINKQRDSVMPFLKTLNEQCLRKIRNQTKGIKTKDVKQRTQITSKACKPLMEDRVIRNSLGSCPSSYIGQVTGACLSVRTLRTHSTLDLQIVCLYFMFFPVFLYCQRSHYLYLQRLTLHSCFFISMLSELISG